ncbi:MAG: HD domain-containing protein [Bacteroidales bacterium]|nr:HD domain-containing protein [Bacteroidales bacterium]
MDYKKEILERLDAIDRQGIDEVMDWLQSSDFFFAPASTAFHGNYEGGLAEHSWNVYTVAMRLRAVAVSLNPSIEQQLEPDSIAIATLLHDVCKADIYKEAVKKRQNKFGSWESYKGYNVDYTNFPLGHGEKSVIILLRLGLDMTDDEIAAIRWHMTAWDLPFQSAEAKGNINAAKDKYPLCSLLQLADGFASSLMEENVRQ